MSEYNTVPNNKMREEKLLYQALLTEIGPALAVLIAVEVGELLGRHTRALRLPVKRNISV